MEGKKRDKFEKCKYKLENTYNKIFIKWQRTFTEEKSKELIISFFDSFSIFGLIKKRK